MPDWTADEAQTLLAMRDSRASLKAIGAAVKKSRSAVAGRIHRLELPLIDPEKAHHTPRGGKYSPRRD